MVIQHNMSALTANRQFNIMNINKTKREEKLSSGYRINRAADDAAGLAISEKMRRQIRGLTQGSQNIQDGISLTQVADGYLNEVHEMIQRINELAVKGANDTLTDEDRGYLNEEVQAIKTEMSRIFDTATFNEKFIFHVPYMPEVTPDPEPYDMQVFYSSNGVVGGLEFNNIRYNIDELKAQGVKLDSDGISTADQEVTFKLKYEPDEEVTLKLKEGDSLANVKRNYKWTADANGIKINNVRAATWAELGVNTTGPNTASTKSFDFRGMEVKFNIEEGDDLIRIMSGINGDSFTTASTWDISASGVTPVSTAAITSGSTTHVRVTNANKNDVNDKFVIGASATGLSIKNLTDGTSTSETAWASINSNGFRIVDWGEDVDGNTAAERSFDNDTTYSYQSPDSNVPIAFNFKLANAASKSEVIESLDGRLIGGEIVCPTRTTSSNSALQISNIRIDGNDSDAFALQSQYGRDFDNSQTNGSTAMSGNVTWTKTVLNSSETLATDTYGGALVNRNTSELGNNQHYYKVEDGGTVKYYKVTETMYEEDSDYRRIRTYAGDNRIQLTYSGQLGDATMKTITSSPVTINYTRTEYTDWSVNGRQYSKYQREEISAGDLAALGLTDADFTAKNDADFQENTEYQSSAGTKTADVSTSGGNVITNNTTLTTQGNFVKSDEADASNFAFSFSHSLTYSQIAAMTDGGTGSSTITTKSLGEAYRNLTPASDIATVHDYDFLNIKVNPPEKHCIIQTAPDAGDPYEIDIKWSPLNLSIASISGADLSTASRCKSTITLAKESLKVISEVRSDFGAYQNRLEHAKKYVDNTAENTQASESRIRDADMAKEMTELSNADIIAQAGQMILSQANQTPQGVLSLLR